MRARQPKARQIAGLFYRSKQEEKKAVRRIKSEEVRAWIKMFGVSPNADLSKQQQIKKKTHVSLAQKCKIRHDAMPVDIQ